MKKLIALICLITTLIVSVTVISIGAADEVSKWNGVVPEADKAYAFDGQGTEESPYLIKSAGELAQFAANVRLADKDTCYLGKYFKLTTDIDMDNKGWYGIGGCQAGSDGLIIDNVQSLRYFAGVFDGDGHVIKNMNLAAKDSTGAVLYQQGLFGYIQGGTVKNIGIESGNIVCDGTTRTAALVGVGRYGFVIQNCYNKANITVNNPTKNTFIGGILGQGIDKQADNPDNDTDLVTKKKTIENCYNTGNIVFDTGDVVNANLEYRIGGIAGQHVGGTPELLNCYSVCDITITDNSTSTKSNKRVGGLAGSLLDSAYMVNSYSKCKIVATTNGAAQNVGAMIGVISGSTTSEETVSNGYLIVAGSSTTVTKALGDTTADPSYVLPVTSVEIPFATGSTFIVDVKAPEVPTTDTEAPDDTKAPETDKVTTPVTTDKATDTAKVTAAAETTTAAEKDSKGCGSQIGFGAGIAMVVLVLSIGSVAVISKRRSDS